MNANKVETRYQVFVSSPFQSLEKERKRAIEGIMDAGHIPIALERFSPSSANDLEVIDNAISDSQIYIVLIGHRSGSMLTDAQKDILRAKYPKMTLGDKATYTEVEYQIAVDHGLMVLAFVMDSNDARVARESDYNDTSDEAIHAEGDRIKAFVEKIDGFKQYWKRKESADLKGMVALAVCKNEAKCTKQGFVKEFPDEATRLVFNSANENTFIIDIARKLTEFAKFNERTRVERLKKEAAARFFKQQYLDTIQKNKISLFFESGSTVAYVAKALVSDLMDSDIHISTNNIAAFLQFMLVSRKSCHLWPWSPPQEPYGASYGDITEIPVRAPDYESGGLCDLAKRAIESLLAREGSIARMKESVLMLGAASGMQIQDYKITYPDKDTRDQDARIRAEQQVRSNCAGPHLSSYHNKVFKCFMFATQRPIMYFITEEKVDTPVQPGHCHFIIESKEQWKNILRDYPIGFCVGCDTKTKGAVAEKFESLGLQVMQGPDSMEKTAFIARNDAFISKIEKQQSL
jgi:hypothetical protein